ncbi:MAG: hypothetical protein C0501_13700 [Isosphaera sp.]|nr:hypothetical protein [Isosphaera sp.]
MVRFLLAAILLCPAARAAPGAERRVVIYDGAATAVGAAGDESKDLWLTLADLTAATRFTLKPEGVCRDEQCFPIPAGRAKEFVAQRGEVTWFNLSEFGRLLQQPVAHDAKHGVWCFGPRPSVQNAHVASRVAPDFTLPDLKGKDHKLSDFRGKKVLLLTWASW